MILAKLQPFYFILQLVTAAANLCLMTNQVTTSEHLEFCQVLSSICAAAKSSRQNYVSCLLLLIKSVRNCPFNCLSNDVIFEIYQGLLDCSIIHYHQEIFFVGQRVIEENIVLSEKYEKISTLYVAFKNLAKFIKNPSKENDLVPVIGLLQLDVHLAESLLPCIFKHLKEFGGKPDDALTLLQHTEEEVISEHIHHQLAEIASPLKNLSLGPSVADMFVDEAVIFALKDNMLSDNVKVR